MAQLVAQMTDAFMDVEGLPQGLDCGFIRNHIAHALANEVPPPSFIPTKSVR